MMDWHLNLNDPTPTKQVKAALESLRDQWVSTTPQETDVDAAKMLELVMNSHNEKRAPVVEMRNKMIADHSTKLDTTHTAIVKQINRAIMAAVAAVNGGKHPVRVSLHGMFRTIAPDGIFERISISYDDAAYQGIPDEDEISTAPAPQIQAAPVSKK